MTAAILALLMCPMAADEPLREDGAIYGVVLNATRDGVPAPNVEVMLRATANGRFELVGETKADSHGKFRFEQLPTGGDFLYLPGANRGGVHYPGPRIQLTQHNPRARVELQIHEIQSHPNPLIAKHHVIRIQPESGALKVTESILVDNPTLKTYVGRETVSDAKPVTLSLAIPPNFDRTTFDQEFFGRRFAITGDKLVTSLPWTPGARELVFTYVVPTEAKQVQWRRPLDLPCSDVQVYVASDRPNQVRCNLGQSHSDPNTSEVVFRSRGPLPPGHVLRVDMGDVPTAWTTHAKWAAAAMLAGLLAVTGGTMLLRHKQNAQPASADRTARRTAVGPVTAPPPIATRPSAAAFLFQLFSGRSDAVAANEALRTPVDLAGGRPTGNPLPAPQGQIRAAAAGQPIDAFSPISPVAAMATSSSPTACKT